MRRFDWSIPRLLVTMAIVVAGLAYVGKFFTVDPVADRGAGEPFTGSWWFPRGGPYILGFDSPGGPGKLDIDGGAIVQGTGGAKVRRGYSPRVPAGGVEAAAGAAPLCAPPGRRGALEYVPPSSLSAQPPELATFTAPGSEIGAALVATAILVVIVLGGLTLARPIVHGRGGPGTMIFVVALVVRLYGLGDAGQTWDEDEYWSSGRNYVVNVLRHDAAPESWRWNFQHPPLTKYLAGVGALWMDGFGVSRVLFALMGAGTCVLAFSIGRRLFSTRVGAFAGVCAALMPHLIAHSRVIGHETPSAFFWSLAVWLALRVNDAHNRDEEVHYIAPGSADLVVRLAAVGGAVGLAAATRYPNLLVPPLVGALVLLHTP